jgi:hypothetical protein
LLQKRIVAARALNLKSAQTRYDSLGRYCESGSFGGFAMDGLQLLTQKRRTVAFYLQLDGTIGQLRHCGGVFSGEGIRFPGAVDRRLAVNFTDEPLLPMITTKGTMKSLMAALLLGGMLSMEPAAAGVFDDMTFSMQDRGGGRGGQGAREARQPVRAQPAPPPPAPRERPRGQMSEEERRQLHRDLDKANREIYRGKRP